MNAKLIHQLRTPGGRCFQLVIAPDGTRVVAGHFHKRELLTLALALDAYVERAKELGNSVEQRDGESLRDLFLGALHHDTGRTAPSL